MAPRGFGYRALAAAADDVLLFTPVAISFDTNQPLPTPAHCASTRGGSVSAALPPGATPRPYPVALFWHVATVPGGHWPCCARASSDSDAPSATRTTTLFAQTVPVACST